MKNAKIIKGSQVYIVREKLPTLIASLLSQFVYYNTATVKKIDKETSRVLVQSGGEEYWFDVEALSLTNPRDEWRNHAEQLELL